MTLSFFLRGILLSFLLAAATAIAADDTQQNFVKVPDKPADLDHQKTLYVVGYSHLDTQWRWSYPQTIREFIPNTMRNNFKLLEKYPNYVFNFSGSRRYEFMKEYYPDDYARLKDYVAQGRWFPCGSSVDETDAVVPSLESYVRNTLYGNRFFRREFHVASEEFMLPDCFGFPACLPSILAHCGIKGFSTQKLTWGSANGIPFKVGVWEGVDGAGVVAALDPGAYTGDVREDLSNSNGWNARIENTAKASGVLVDYHYFGAGDRGGAPNEESVQWVERSVAGAGPIRVIESAADRMVKDITPEEKARLPRYKGELLLTNHSAGAINSAGYMKRWNRKNELLANAAESAASTAFALGGLPYPGDTLYTAWDLVLGSQMHDMLPGTSLPQAYNYCWNDEILASNQFAAVAESSSSAVIAGMDTRVADKAIPLVVYNPLSIEREDVVEASIPLTGDASTNVMVYGPDGHAVPTQIKAREKDRATILFLAKAPSVGYAVYEARPGGEKAAVSALQVTSNSLENERYKVQLNDDGDVSSIFDKAARKEILRAPAQLVFQHEKPQKYPAWNMDWEDRQKPPTGFVGGPATPAKVTILESGPVRVSLQVERSAFGSKFTQQIRLGAGDAGNRVEFVSDIAWNTRESSLRAAFPLTVSNPLATYDAQLGAVQRGNNEPKKFEVPQQQWIDLTDSDGKYGVSILNDCKYGSDKPDDQTVRLTLLYTPGVRDGYQDQGTQELGLHEMTYAVMGHSGDWSRGGTVWEAARLNQPLRAFTADAHSGALGRSFSLFQVNNSQAQITAVKKAEDSNELIVRVRELSGQPLRGVRITSALPLAGAREVNGQEMDLGTASIDQGALAFDLTPYQLRAFAIKIGAPAVKLVPPVSQALALPYNLDAVSPLTNLTDGAFDSEGHTYSAEQFPRKLVREGIEFDLGPGENGKPNALRCKGQTLDLPAGPFNRVYFLASAVDGDRTASFKVGDASTTCTVQDWSAFIGQWDSRVWKGPVPELTYTWDNALIGLAPGYVKPGKVAWYCSHRHDPRQGNEFYQYTYLFEYGLDLPPGARKLTLPKNDKIRIFAVSVANEPGAATRTAAPLFDTLSNHVADMLPDVAHGSAPAP